MARRQLNLFTTRSILCQRFDAAFFRNIPRCPGVYLMSDGCERIIYVGKAKDLRARLGSYRYADETCSRKTARLIARVTHIRWQIFPTEEAALLEENRLLRKLRPRFNRANTWPRAYRFIRIAESGSSVQLTLSSAGEGECYGAFKGASRQTFAALLRLLASMEAPYSALPRRLVCEPWPVAFEFTAGCAEMWLEELRPFLRGERDDLLRRVHAPGSPDESLFHVGFRTADLQAVERFFLIGPRRNFSLRQQQGRAAHLIAQEDLDDWIVRTSNTSV